MPKSHWLIPIGFIIAILSLAECNGNNPSPPPAGQWTCYGCKGMSVAGDGSFTFPNSNGAVGYIYKAISGNPQGKTIALNYTVGGTGTVTPSPASGSGPAQVRLFMWRKDDNLSCAGNYASYRWWARNGFGALTDGTRQIAAVVVADQWTNCIGQTDANGFSGAIGNLLGVGFTFGAEFYGHGVYSTGTNTFKLNSFTVQ